MTQPLSVPKHNPTREQRRAIRLQLTPGEVTFHTGAAEGIFLQDVSVSGMSFVVPPGVHKHPKLMSGVLRLGERAVEVQLQPAGVSRVSAGERVGARFVDPTHLALNHLGGFLVERFIRQERQLAHLWQDHERTLRFRDEREVGELLRYCAIGHAAPIHVYRDRRPLGVSLMPETFEAGNLLTHLTRVTSGELRSGETYDFILPGAWAATLFSTRVAGIRDGNVALAMPSELRQCGFRESGRSPLLHGQVLNMTVPHPRQSAAVLRGTIAEVSASGLSFAAARGPYPLLPGDALEDLRIDIGGVTIAMEASIRRVGPDVSGIQQCGVEIIMFHSKSDQQTWNRFVFEQRYPRSTVNRAEIVQSAWELLDTSDYLKLWVPQHLYGHLRSAFMRHWTHQVDGTSGHLAIMTENRKNVGTFAASRIYPQTWLLHSLGVDRSGRTRTRLFLDVTRELYDSVLHLVQHSDDAHYFLLYVAKDKRWTKLLYGNFVAAYGNPSSMVYDSYHLYKRVCDTPAPAAMTPTGYTVRQLSSKELPGLEIAISQRIHPLERSAFAYDSDLDLSIFRRSEAMAGQGRHRDVITASCGAKLVAALIAEVGDEGSNIFGLLNRCRIVWFCDTTEKPAVRAALLGEATSLYRARHKPEFVFIDDDADPLKPVTPLGFQHVSEGIRWLAPMTILPIWRSYIDQVLGARGRTRVRNDDGPGVHLD